MVRLINRARHHPIGLPGPENFHKQIQLSICTLADVIPKALHRDCLDYIQCKLTDSDPGIIDYIPLEPGIMCVWWSVGAGAAYAALKLQCQIKSQCNNWDSGFHYFRCSLTPRAIFVDFISLHCSWQYVLCGDSKGLHVLHHSAVIISFISWSPF